MNKVQKGASSDATLHRRTAETAKGDHAFFAFLDGEGFVSSTSSCQQNRNVTFEKKSASSHQNWQLAKKTTECYSISTSFITIHFGFITLTFSFCGVWETCPRLPRHPRHHQLLRRLPCTLSWPPQINVQNFGNSSGKSLKNSTFMKTCMMLHGNLNGNEALVKMMCSIFSSNVKAVTVPSSCFLFAGGRLCIRTQLVCLCVCVCSVIWWSCKCVAMTLHDTTWPYFEGNVYV